MKLNNSYFQKFIVTIFLIFVFNLLAFSQLLNVKKYGARGDGKTDDTKAVQATIDAAIKLSKPIVYFPAGIYVIGSYHLTNNYLENYCIRIHSGITFKGSGNNSVIKLADHIFDKRDTAANAHIFYGINIHTLKFISLLIDMNGVKNLVPESVIKNNMALFVENGSDIDFSNVTIKNCSGTNMIAIRGIGHGVNIKNCFFYNGGNYVGTPAANKFQVDFSFIYSEWDSTNIINNHIEQQNVGIALSNYTGGIELHGSYCYAAGNTIIGCNPGLYISSTWHSMEKTTVTNNKIEQCLRGIAFWVHYPLNNITISNNDITLTYSRLLKPAMNTGIEIPNGNAEEYSFKLANNAVLNNLIIYGNTISASLDDTTNDKTVGLLLHSLQNSRIENNTIVGMNYGGVVIQGSKWGMKSVTFEKNNFINFKTNNDLEAVAGYVVITDTYTKPGNNAPGIREVLFSNNNFNRAISAKPVTPSPKQKKGSFLGAFIALPSNMLNGIHFEKNVFSDKSETVVSVKTD
jgi:hypothetical protein